MTRRVAAYGAVALLSLTTARLVATDLAALHRRANAGPSVIAPRAAPTTSTRPGVPVGQRALVVTTDPPWSPPVGSLVDVYAAADPFGVGAPGPRPALLVAAGAKVLRRDDRDDHGRVTLLVSVDAARLVAAAAASGPVVLALAPDKEPGPSKTSSSASSRD